MPGPLFEITSHWRLNGAVSEIADIMSDPLSLEKWWAPVFMRVELLKGGNEQLLGTVVRLYTKGFLPHTFQFLAEVTRVDESNCLIVETRGDFHGVGTIEISEQLGQAHVRIHWRVKVHHPYLRLLLHVLKPVFVANHRWAMRRGEIGLQKEIYRRRGQAIAHVAKPTFPHNLNFLQKRFAWSERRLKSTQGRGLRELA